MRVAKHGGRERDAGGDEVRQHQAEDAQGREQRRPALNLNAVNKLVSESEGDEQSLYVLLAATGMRISEALALESKHFVNNCRTIQVCQQVDRDHPRIVNYVKTDAGFREVDLCTAVGEYLQAFINRKDGLLFETQNGTPHLHILIDRFIEQQWIKTTWQQIGGGMHVDIRRVDVHRVSRYVSKYLTKELLTSAPERSRRVGLRPASAAALSGTTLIIKAPCSTPRRWAS